MLVIGGALVCSLRRSRPDGDGSSNGTPKIFVRKTGQPSSYTRRPADLTAFAWSRYDAQWKLCRQPWSRLLADASEPPSRALSRSALNDVAAKLPYFPNSTSDPLLDNIATSGCVAGYLDLLKTDPTYARS